MIRKFLLFLVKLTPPPLFFFLVRYYTIQAFIKNNKNPFEVIDIYTFLFGNNLHIQHLKNGTADNTMYFSLNQMAQISSDGLTNIYFNRLEKKKLVAALEHHLKSIRVNL